MSSPAALADKDAASLVQMGLSLQSSGKLQEAAVVMFQACKKDADSYNAHLFLGHLLCDLGRPKDAVGAYRRASCLAPARYNAHLGLASALQELEDHAGALQSFETAAGCQGLKGQELADCYFNWGNSLSRLGHKLRAEVAYSKSIEVMETPEACNNLADLLWELGDVHRAAELLERCCQLAPDSGTFSQNRLMLLNYLPEMSPKDIFDAHRAWGEHVSRGVGSAWQEWPALSKDPGRKLNVAYLSPDYFQHSTSYFAFCLVDYHDRDRYNIFLYSNTVSEDAVTDEFKRRLPETNWRRVLGMSAQDVGGLIRTDEIDILVDLAGHTSNNRLDVMALKPAPVQITWCGYQNTSGLGAIDYLITDSNVDPPETEQLFTEELIRLPQCLNCYTPPCAIPEVGCLPALSNGFITFGSFNNIYKLSPNCVALWARILKEVPGSRLLLKAKGFTFDDVKAKVAGMFEAHGIDRTRLILTPFSADHLQVYSEEVDIALDTCPYSSPTTACEALLMGVPVVCLGGSTHCSRRALTVVAAVGRREELVASSPDEYVKKAVQCAGDFSALQKLREGLRPALLASPMCDGLGFVQGQLEPALRFAWQRFCEGWPPSKQP